MRIARPDAMPPQPARSGLLTNILRGWNKFWFTPASPLPLGLIRICTGFVILYIHAIYSLDLLALVGPEGWIDHKTITEFRTGTQFYPIPGGWPSDGSPDDMFSTTPSQGLPSWSVYFHITDTTAIVACHIGFLIAMAMFTVGFATRVTSVLAWVGVISYIQRTPTTVFGMDTMMNILMVYLMIGPSGATLSVDRWIQKWRARKEGREPDPVQPSVMANFAIRLMQVHFCFIYMASGLSKLQGPAWWNGTALWGTMANYSFAPMDWPAYKDFLAFLARNRPLWEVIMIGGSYFTLFVEISFCYLIWRPKTRWFMMTCSILLHTGIGIIMGLTTFSLFMFCLVMSFMPVETIERFLNALSRGFSRTAVAPAPVRA